MPDFVVNPAAGNVATALDLRSLVDVEELQRIQDDFVTPTGLAAITVDSMDRPVTEAPRSSTLCQHLYRDPMTRVKCYSCDAHGGLQSVIEGRPVVYRCHVGLVGFPVSIIWGAQYLGVAMARQVLLTGG